jgi:hypothetical protein
MRDHTASRLDWQAQKISADLRRKAGYDWSGAPTKYNPNACAGRISIADMKKQRKRWTKPILKDVPIFFECTCYAGAI